MCVYMFIIQIIINRYVMCIICQIIEINVNGFLFSMNEKAFIEVKVTAFLIAFSVKCTMSSFKLAESGNILESCI